MSSSTDFADVGGHRIAYHRRGAGEPMILVHGITTYSFIWESMIPDLSKHYDVIALDLLGCGESDMPLDVSYAIQDHADRLFEFAAALGIEKFHLVGHDLGGGTSQIYAVRHPETLLSLTLINTVGYDFWPVQPITALRTPVVRQLLMASLDAGMFRMVVKRGVFHKDRVTPAIMERFARPLETSLGRQAFMHFARCLDNHNLMDITDDLQRLPVPTLIIRGDADVYLNAMIADQLHHDVPNSRLVHIPTAGHFAQLDEPEQMAADILEFADAHHG